jgi:hypothetical protein
MRPDIEADGGADRGELHNRCPPLAGDDARDHPAGHAARSPHVGITQPSHPLGQRDLGQNALLVVFGNSDRTSDRTVSIRHGPILPMTSWSAIG